MPRIFLKPNSAEYADTDDRKSLRVHKCDMPGCSENADFKAPKDRALKEYYRFCLNHVQEYNKAWNFFAGMAQADIESHMVNSTLGDRPTWRYDGFANLEDALRTKVWQSYHYTDKKPENGQKHYESQFAQNSPEHEAMAIMGLMPPLSLRGIKTRYKELAKKYHPDLNKDPKAEELLKSINMAYTILKLAYEKYEKFEGKQET